MLLHQIRSVVERCFDVTLSPLAERHPFDYVGVNEDGYVDLFVLYLETQGEAIPLDVSILAHAHGLTGVTLKHCILVTQYEGGVLYEYFENIRQKCLPILPYHPRGMMMPVMSVSPRDMQELPT